MKKKEEM